MGTLRIGTLCACIIWITAAGLAGCGSSDDPFAGVSPGKDAAGTAAGAADGQKCTPNQFYCNGTTAWICRADGSEFDQKQCPGGCTNNQCVTQACVPGTRQCQSSRTLRTCRADGSRYDITACPESCRNGQCVSATGQQCQPGQRTCTDQRTSAICKADRSGFDTETCPVLCDNGLCVQSCTPGAKTCQDSRTERTCRPDGLGFTVKSCSSGCSNNACAAPACQPGALRCGTETNKQRQVEQCTSDGRTWKFTGKECATTCQNGQCVTQSCRPNETFCDGDKIKRCNGSGSAASDSETCEFGCSTPSPAVGPVCNKCATDALQCRDANTPQVCDDPTAGWRDLSACGDDEGCVGGFCAPTLAFTPDESRDDALLWFMIHVASCWLGGPGGGDGNRICYAIDTLDLPGPFDENDLRDWYCDGRDGGSVTVESYSAKIGESFEGHSAQTLYDISDDLAGCGAILPFIPEDEIDIKPTDGVLQPGRTLGFYCLSYDTFWGDEVHVIECAEFQP